MQDFRVIDLPERTTLDSSDYTMIDSAENGTNKYLLSRQTAETDAKIAAAVEGIEESLTELEADLSDTSDVVTKISDDSYSKILISYDGYDSNRSLTSVGKNVTTGSVILSFPVTAGAFIKVSLVNRTGGDILYFFQDQKTVPWDSNTHIIGDIHSGSSYTGYLCVPSGATYLVTNADMSNVVSTVESVDSSVLTDLKTTIDDIETLTFDTVHGKNLTYVDGTIYDSSDYELSDYIPVNAGDILYVTAVWGGSSISNYNGVCGYASDKSFVSGLINQYTALGLSGGRNLIENYEYIVPNGISYIRGTSAYKDGGGYGVQSPFIVAKKNQSSLEYRVANIEDDTSKNDPLIALSEYNSFLSGDASAATAYKKLFTLSAFTDLHGAKNQWNGFIEFTNQYKKYFDCAVFLGDICGINPDSDISFYNPKQSQVPFLSVVGNHDAADWGKSISQNDIFNRYIKPCVDAGYISTTKSYYYKDFADYKIRIITLFEYENAVASTTPNSDNWRRYISTEQLQWFADTLYDTPSDYSVIVLLHQVVFPQPTIVDNKFTENEIYRQVSADFTSGFGYILTNMGWSGDEIGEVVNAYIHGLPINKTYEAHMTNAGTVINVSVAKDFSERGQGRFVCYLAGHTHAPFVLKVKDYDDQLQILLPSASDNYYQRKADDIRPVSDSPNFYSLAFDTTNKLIKIVKVGHRTTMNMIERDFISIPY